VHEILVMLKPDRAAMEFAGHLSYFDALNLLVFLTLARDERDSREGRVAFFADFTFETPLPVVLSPA
jgi:hypothetical protein